MKILNENEQFRKQHQQQFEHAQKHTAKILDILINAGKETQGPAVAALLGSFQMGYSGYDWKQSVQRLRNQKRILKLNSETNWELNKSMHQYGTSLRELILSDMPNKEELSQNSNEFSFFVRILLQILFTTEEKLMLDKN